MNNLTFTLLTALLLAPLATLHAEEAVKPWTLAERNGRACLLTPAGKPFLMLGISHVGQGSTQTEGELRGWGFNTVPSPEFWDRFPFIVPLDRLVGAGESRFEDVFDPAFKAGCARRPSPRARRPRTIRTASVTGGPTSRHGRCRRERNMAGTGSSSSATCPTPRPARNATKRS